MSVSDYQIQVLHPKTGEHLKIYTGQQLEDMRYERVLNGIGKFAMSLDDADGLDDIFVPDAFVEVYRTDPVSGDLMVEDTYLVVSTERSWENDRQWFIVGGLSLNHLIARRVVNPADDPNGAGGYSTKAGPADVVIRNYAREQFGSLASAARQIPNLSISGVAGTAPNVGARKRYEDNLLELFKSLVVGGRTDFILRRTSGVNLRFEIGIIGTDRTKTTNFPTLPYVLLDPDRGNLDNPSLRIDRGDEINVVYALGKGEGAGQQVIQVIGSGTTDSPFARKEASVAAQETEVGDSLALYTEAGKRLNDKRTAINFNFDLNTSAAGAIYQKDFFLGDELTVIWRDFETDLRVRSVEISISAQGETIAIGIDRK